MPIKTINGEKLAALVDGGTLTSSDDLNAVTDTGIYWWSGSNKPANAPNVSGNVRMLVVKSLTADNHGAEWQLAVMKDMCFYRTHGPGTSDAWGDWHQVGLGSDLTTLEGKALAVRGTLTSSDDLDTVAQPGVYYWSNTSIPAHVPSGYAGSARVLVVKSDSTSNLSAVWQMFVGSGGALRFRSKMASSGSYSDWAELPSNVGELLNSALRYVGGLSASDDLDAIDKLGAYYYDRLDRPEHAPAKLSGIPIVYRRSADHAQEAQMVLSDGVLYYRNHAGASGGWYDWKSVGLGSPVYQTEELPYDAQLYHAKWDSLIQPRVLRRVDLGVVDNDSSLPMYAYEFCPQRDFVGLTSGGGGSTPVLFDWTNALYQRPKVLVIGGAHGNEKCTPMDIYAIAKRLLTRDYNDIACKFDWYFIPLVNPWGYSHARLDSDGNVIYDNGGETAQVVACSSTVNAGIRNNAHGQNINRDWSDVIYTSGGVSYGFQTPELQLIKDYVLGIAPDLFIDAHQNHANASAQTYPIVCHAGAAVDEGNGDPEYTERMRKIYRHIDVANADTDKTMLRYASNVANTYQACRIWPTIRAATSEHYFSGVTALNGSTVIGNTEHRDVCTDYSVCSETSEIAYTYSGTTDWYNPVACTFSCTYLWNIIKRMAELF